MEDAKVETITVNDTQECDEKKCSTAGIIPKSILTPMKKRIKLTPCFRNRNIPMIPFNAKNKDIKPITANTLDVIARNCSSPGVNILVAPSLITPIMAGIESTAKRTSVEPMTKKTNINMVMWRLPFIFEKKWG